MPNYLELSNVESVKITPAPMSGRTVTGYGRKIPTEYIIRCRINGYHNDHRNRRVYAMCYGNSASFYVRMSFDGSSHDVFLSSEVEHMIEHMREHNASEAASEDYIDWLRVNARSYWETLVSDK